ncbi:MAG: glycosyltransferase family 2 protein [Butyrivibrio sp.]|uniref:glycosyltransferase family A protein n=1 Tax=Butyrivibrio sp. TaxID=28121 RepID=UPI001B4BB40A|nr:glycosyltransferase family A protein [Butyrivibrio sp.]MBP3782318.1 glycosyltransferase family 2 protein [Butyrivibrio sp.]
MGRSMEQKRLQILISAVNKDPEELIGSMNLGCDAVIVNQLIGDFDEKIKKDGDQDYIQLFEGFEARVITRREKGVGLSRNTALEASDHELIQFGDDDIVYDDGYVSKVIAEFDAHPEADMLLFNVKAQAGRETYWNEDFAKVNWRNYGRYPAYAICARREALVGSGVKYSLLFGGGAPYMNGEDSLFLHDCLKAGLNIYRTTVAIGKEKQGQSTWFKGYTDKFFFDRGVLYHFLYGRMAVILGFRFLLKNRKEMCSEKGLLKCWELLIDGVKHGSTIS